MLPLGNLFAFMQLIQIIFTTTIFRCRLSIKRYFVALYLPPDYKILINRKLHHWHLIWQVIGITAKSAL